MTIQRESVHFQILERLCSTERHLRGTSGAMLNRDYGEPRALSELAAQGLIKERGWHAGPGTIWIPTDDGIALYESIVAADGAAAEKSPMPERLRPADD